MIENVNSNLFTKKHTQIAKGLAMILMLFDHLFWLGNGHYTSIFPVVSGGRTVEWIIGSIGNICVSMYLVLSGYGMYCVVKNKEKYTFRDTLIRIRNIWINYAFITIAFIVIDLIFGKIKWNPLKIVLNILALDYSYNAYAWFMITYIIIMLIFPIWLFFVQHFNWIWQIVFIIAVKGGITIINMGLNHIVDVPHIIYETCIEPFMFLPAFLIGYMCAEYSVFEKMYQKIFKGSFEKAKLLVGLLLIFLFIYKFQYTLLDNITAPIICFLISYLCYSSMIGKILSYIGKHSTAMWIIHYPIMILLLNSVVYYPKVSILILLELIIILLPMCYMSEWLNQKILKIIGR